MVEVEMSGSPVPMSPLSGADLAKEVQEGMAIHTKGHAEERCAEARCTNQRRAL